MLTPLKRRLSRQNTLKLLQELEMSSSSISSLCFTPGIPRAEVEQLLKGIIGTEEILPEIAKEISRSSTGAGLFWGERHRYLVLAPFPVTRRSVASTCDVEPLRSVLTRELRVALVLVRLGAYAIGVFQGEKLLSSKVGRGLVHARHRQGGSSSGRFVRHREKQMESFFTRICEHAHEQLEPHARQLDFLVYGGARETLLTFRKQCRYLHGFDSRTLEPILNIREPRQATLEAAIGEAWSSQVIEWQVSE